MPNLLLIGPINNGKSMLIEKFWRAHHVEPVLQADVGTLPVVTMQMPSEPSVSRFYLVLIDQTAVLPHLYARVVIPQAVFGELQDEGTPAKVKE